MTQTLNQFLMIVPTLFLTLVFTGCATSYVNPQLQLSSESDYFSSIRENTKKIQTYDGLHESIQFYATFLSGKVQLYQTDHMARIYQWNPEQYENQKNKVENNLSQQTEIFLSFYTPDKKNDNLSKKKSVWKVFLDVGGRRFEAKIEKLKNPQSELLSFYPFHNNWSSPYRLTFGIPSAISESSPRKLTITGPVGSGSVEFKN